VASWCYLSKYSDKSLAEDAEKSLSSYPEKSLMAVFSSSLPACALSILAEIFENNEAVLEKILLHEKCPTEVFLSLAPKCSESLTVIIADNQERIIESPEIIPALEANPNNLKSNTDRLRQFLKLAGVYV